ncbi:hypothetical protein E3W21_08175 [Pseudomonas sp. F01002]|nr:hypothetical protein E3W21_08175 [Pseudomonas sp. F01002]
MKSRSGQKRSLWESKNYGDSVARIELYLCRMKLITTIAARDMSLRAPYLMQVFEQEAAAVQPYTGILQR